MTHPEMKMTEVLVNVPWADADALYEKLAAKGLEPYQGYRRRDGVVKVAFPCPDNMTIDQAKAVMADAYPGGQVLLGAGI